MTTNVISIMYKNLIPFIFFDELAVNPGNEKLECKILHPDQIGNRNVFRPELSLYCYLM